MGLLLILLFRAFSPGLSINLALPDALPPVDGLTFRRTAGTIFSTRFVALVADQEIGVCECETDMTQGGTLPALQGWGELSEPEVNAIWRNRGIGTWLVRQAVAWHQLGGGDRIILVVTPDDEAAGAERFYQRLGWQVLVRQRKGWRWEDHLVAKAPEIV